VFPINEIVLLISLLILGIKLVMSNVRLWHKADINISDFHHLFGRSVNWGSYDDELMKQRCDDYDTHVSIPVIRRYFDSYYFTSVLTVVPEAVQSQVVGCGSSLLLHRQKLF